MIDKPITIFPGNKVEYEEVVGYKVEIFDKGHFNCGLKISKDGALVYIDQIGCKRFLQVSEWEQAIKAKGVEAIVNAQFIPNFPDENGFYYGLPVKKKQSNEARQ